MKKLTRSLSGFNHKGFTLAELLVAMMVTSIILAAVATLAYSLGRVSEDGDYTAEKQAHLRYVTMRISELIRYSKLVYSAEEKEIVLWRDDDGDDAIEAAELIKIERGTEKGYYQLRELDGTSDPIVLIHHCHNVKFGFDQPSEPPTKRKLVIVSFDLNENGVMHQYQISAALRCWAGYMLDADGNII